MRDRIWIAGTLLLAALLSTACGPGGGPQGGGQQGGTGGALSVAEKEWAITVPSEVSAGSVKFAVKNDGSVEHNFVVKEADVRLDGIQPGQTKELTVNLKPGTYTLLCDIPGHEEAGMKATITVK